MTDDDAPQASAATPQTSAAFTRVQGILATLERDKLVELKKKANREALAEALMEELAKRAGAKDLGAVITEWFVERDDVVDVFATDEEMDAALRA